MATVKARNTMSVFKLVIRQGNAAFLPNPQHETARILRKIADRVENGENVENIFDINGNCVGGAGTVNRRVE